MEEKISEIRTHSIEEIEKCKTQKELNDLKVKYLGKKGELTAVLRGMGSVSPEERPVIGSLVNKLRDELNELIENKDKEFKKQELQEKLLTENIDITEPSKKIQLGSLHPITQVIKEIEEYRKNA